MNREELSEVMARKAYERAVRRHGHKAVREALDLLLRPSDEPQADQDKDNGKVKQ